MIASLRRHRRARLLLLGIAVLAVLMLALALVEWNASREELIGTLDAEAATLIEALNRSGETIAEASAQLEELLLARLVATTRLASHLEEHGILRDERLGALASESGVEVLAVASPEGRVLSESAASLVGRSLPPDIIAGIGPVARGEYAWVSLGVQDYPSKGSMLLVAHERRGSAGVILAGIDARTLLDFRRRTGIGRLLRSLGRNPNIVYIAIQDRDGILSASEHVDDLGGIDADTFLSQALTTDRASTRILELKDEKVLEVVRRIDMQGQAPALTRVALSLDNVRSIQQRAMRRILFIGLGVVIAAGLLMGFLLTRERYGVLREEHRRITTYTERVLEHIADAVVATDAQGLITVYNGAAERLFGLAEGDALGQHCETVFPNDALLLCETLRSGPSEYSEREFRIGHGAAATIAVSTSLITAADGTPDTAIAVVRDLTEERRMREQLRQREQLSAMGSLASGIAHEIRNPLNAIGVIAQRFRAEFVPQDGAEEYRVLADTVRAEVRRVNDIVTQFLAFAKPAPIVPVPRDLGETVRDAIRVIDSQARAASVQLRFEENSTAIVALDTAKWTQALLNLFQNALDAMSSGGVLSCALDANHGQATLTISDTGTGISDEDLPRIFNMYFSRKQHGTGLGLSLVHQIISEHGGSIFASTNPGRGSTFTISLPLAAVTEHGVDTHRNENA